MLTIIETSDGSHTIFSMEFGSNYHSEHGAVQESMHVFIKHGLHYVAAQKQEIKVLEMGFGTGLNAWLALIEAEKLGLRLDYTAIEAYPLLIDMVAKLNYPEQLPSENGKQFFEQIHAAAWGDWVEVTPHFKLKKIHAKLEETAFCIGFDLIFYDAFDPAAQPVLWEAPMMQRMYEVLSPGGILVTYCAKGTFRRALKSVGFLMEELPGPPGKRIMTRAIRMSDGPR